MTTQKSSSTTECKEIATAAAPVIQSFASKIEHRTPNRQTTTANQPYTRTTPRNAAIATQPGIHVSKELM
jgi:hypothetical protein